MARQFIYHMQGLTKTYPTRKVLENINLSFYPDAKIGVLGVNGSGKSTLLRIMAGIDKEFTGEGWVAEGARVGYLEQEPQLDPKKTFVKTSWRASLPRGRCSIATTKSLPTIRTKSPRRWRSCRTRSTAKICGSRFPGRPRDGRAALSP